jgi:hypothetical protein
MRTLESLILTLTLAFCTMARGAETVEKFTLDNGIVSAGFGSAGMLRISDSASRQNVELIENAIELVVDGEKITLAGLKSLGNKQQKERIIYAYQSGDKQLEVQYELKPGWHFVSKQILLTFPAARTGRVDSVEMLRLESQREIAREHKVSNGSGAVFLRLGEPKGPPKIGVFLALQNPFLKWVRNARQVSMSYAPEMEWRAEYGPFASDRVCIGLYSLTGVEFPANNIDEWKYIREPENAFNGKQLLDLAESDALTNCVNAFALFRPTQSVRVHVPWCENDYQIDVATPAGRAEWKRILDQCAAIGCNNTLFTPANSAIAPLKDNADAWGWENCLWLGLGQKIRRGEWNIATDPIPPSIQEMLDYAKAKQVKLVAYAYPTLGWKQNPEWTAWCGGKTGGYDGVDTGVRSFQDWFVDQLVAFQKRTGISGYSFDHWWIAYEPTKVGKKPTSKYAQWYGCRRVLEELRRRIPDVVIDGRQQYQWFGVWTWLGGSYPHPTMNDEQPGSFKNFPDLHFSRVSGDRQRWASWNYHMQNFTPWELVPGFMTHQTPRNDAKGQCVRDRSFQARDWDYLGWRYSIMSSIGTAPFNHVVDLLPARDETEFQHFRSEDQRWLRQWMDWTDEHRATLQHLRPIIGPPVFGRVDGTAAIDGDHGFVFLFNPNYRELVAEFKLDASIGVTRGESFVFRELYPRPGLLHGTRPLDGAWKLGDTVQFRIKGPQALVLELVPASSLSRPALLNVEGKAAMTGTTLTLADVKGEIGTRSQAIVLLPDAAVDSVTVNGVTAQGFSRNPGALTLPLAVAGARFSHCEQVGSYDRTFSDTVFRADFTVPQRVFTQLAERRKAWPVQYTAEELLATWRGSDRLLLFIQIAEPDDKWNVSLKLNGQPIEVKKAYSDVFPLGRASTFTGFYADLSQVKPDTRYEIEVTLPERLQPGQFQGVFFENVETEFTSETNK